MADDIEDIEALDLKEQLALWRQEHPKRNYVGSQKLRWLPARRAAGGTASGVPGAASGAPPSVSPASKSFARLSPRSSPWARRVPSKHLGVAT